MNNRKFSFLKKYLTLTRAGIIESLSFRASYLVTFLCNLVYLVIIYFLWKAIYDSSPTNIVNGMTFTDTMIYLVLATAIFNFMEVFLVWDMGRSIQTGKIVLDITKPMNYQSYMFFSSSGQYIISFFTTFLPTFIIVSLIARGEIVFGINLLMFVLSMLMGLIINFCIDFLVGTVCLYTQSTWGLNIMKEVVVLLLSGVMVPIAFFPEPFKTIVGYLPFQAIYNTPLSILVNHTLTIKNYMGMLLIQLFWLLFIATVSHLFWKKSLRNIAVNGG